MGQKKLNTKKHKKSCYVYRQILSHSCTHTLVGHIVHSAPFPLPLTLAFDGGRQSTNAFARQHTRTRRHRLAPHSPNASSRW